MRSIFRAVLAVLVTVVVANGCSGKNKTQSAAFPDSLRDAEAVVTVNSQSVTGRDLRVFALVYTPEAADSLTDRLFNLHLLNGYVDRIVLSQTAVAAGTAITDSTVQWYLDRFVASVGGTDMMEQYLAGVGVNHNELVQTIRRDLVIRAYIEGPLANSITVTDADAEAFYLDHKDAFTEQDSVRASHIIVRTDANDTPEMIMVKRERLEGIRRRLLKGEDFAQLARENSEGPSAPYGGDLGYFSKRDMVTPFADAAFSMAVGKISPIVETNFGYHIIKVTGKKTAKASTYDDVESMVKAQLKQQRLGAELENYLKRTRTTAIIEPQFNYGGLTQRESATFTR